MGLKQFNQDIRNLDVQRGEWVNDLEDASKTLNAFAGEIQGLVYPLSSPRPGITQQQAITEATLKLNDIARRMQSRAVEIRAKEVFY